MTSCSHGFEVKVGHVITEGGRDLVDFLLVLGKLVRMLIIIVVFIFVIVVGWDAFEFHGVLGVFHFILVVVIFDFEFDLVILGDKDEPSNVFESEDFGWYGRDDVLVTDNAAEFGSGCAVSVKFFVDELFHVAHTGPRTASRDGHEPMRQDIPIELKEKVTSGHVGNSGPEAVSDDVEFARWLVG